MSNGYEAWNDDRDYERALLNQLSESERRHWKFLAWLKYTHPHVLEEFNAVEDVERSANHGI